MNPPATKNLQYKISVFPLIKLVFRRKCLVPWGPAIRNPMRMSTARMCLVRDDVAALQQGVVHSLLEQPSIHHVPAHAANVQPQTTLFTNLNMKAVLESDGVAPHLGLAWRPSCQHPHRQHSWSPPSLARCRPLHSWGCWQLTSQAVDSFYVLQRKSLWKSHLSTSALDSLQLHKKKNRSSLKARQARRDSSFHSIKSAVGMSGVMWIISKGQSVKCQPIRKRSKKMSMTGLEEVNIWQAGVGAVISVLEDPTLISRARLIEICD